MICPQTKEQCRNHVTCSAIEECLHPSGGKLPPKTEFGKKLIDLRAKAVANGMPLEEPPPTLAEIERLAGDVSLALSALLAAVRKLGE